jgi:hypothetical protein
VANTLTDRPIGQITPGNIDLNDRMAYRNPDGSLSTVRSMSIGTDKGEVLIPTITNNGDPMTADEAISLYRSTGKHLGIFQTPEAATHYARALHKQQESLYATPGQPTGDWLAEHPSQGSISAQPPTARQRQTDAFRNMLFSDDREGQGKADRLMNVLDVTGANIPAAMYDVGQAAGRGDLGALAITGVAAALPVVGRSLRSTPAREFLRDASGMFMGPKAKTANKAMLAQAMDMQAAGHDRDAIFGQTGWFQGRDSKWRFEVPSDKSEFVEPLNHPRPTQSQPTRSYKLGDVYNHPGLYEAYPELRNMEVKYGQTKGGSLGAYDSNEKNMHLFNGQFDTSRKSILNHEVQHAVQDIEGFEGGTGQSSLLSDLRGTTANQLYRQKIAEYKTQHGRLPGPGDEASIARQAADEGYDRSAGEVEARNTQRRATGRYDRAPWQTQDLPDDQQMLEEPPQSVLDNLLGKFGVKGPGFGKRQSMMASEPRRVPSTNYVVPMGDHEVKSMWREMSPNAFDEVAPSSWGVSGGNPYGVEKQHYAETEHMALGQGSNRGVRVEFDPSGYEGQINRAKPGWEHMYQNGDAEFLARPLKETNVRGSVRQVFLDKTAPLNRRQKMLFQDLETQGWKKVEEKNGVRYIKP